MTTTTTAAIPVPRIYAAMNAVKAALATSGISKSRTNEQQHYAFRGIDDVYNAVAGLLATLRRKIRYLPPHA